MKMKRKIIHINEDLCNGCEACVTACHEGAIGMVNGKAKLLRDDFCDGLGDCLPVCPTGAITFEERDALPFDEEAVKKNQQLAANTLNKPVGGGCPGSRMASFNRIKKEESAPSQGEIGSELSQWPVQIKLVPIKAPYFDNANLLIAADCAAYAYGDFHKKFIRNKTVVIGCPKLDEGDYAEKLTAIIQHNDIKSVTVVRMEVPCCGGIERAAKTALQNSGKFIPWQIVTITLDGRIIE